MLPMAEPGPVTPASTHTPTAPARKPAIQPKRLARMAGLLLVAAAPPMIAITWLFGVTAAETAVFGVLIALMNMIMGGLRIAIAAAIALILATPISLVCGLSPLAGAAFMAVACIVVGASAGWGLQRGLTMVPLAIAYLLISPPAINGQAADPTSTTYVLTLTATMALAALFPLIVLPHMMKQMPAPQLTHNSRADSVEYAIIISTLTAVATGFVLAIQPGRDAFWLILTLLVVVQVGPQATIRKTISRSSGTVLGAAISIIIVILIPNSTVLFCLGIVAMLLTLTFAGGSRYWLYTACLTPTIVLTSSASNPSTAEFTAEVRVLYTLIGAALALIAFAISVALQRILNQPSEHPASTDPR